MLGGAEERLVSALVENGLIRLRSQAPAVYIDAVEEWLWSENALLKALGLRALALALADPRYENLPRYFNLLTPFLRQAVEALEESQAAFLARQTLPRFPPEVQAGLKEALRGKK